MTYDKDMANAIRKRCAEQADEIERLRAELDKKTAEANAFFEDGVEVRAQLAVMRKALDNLIGAARGMPISHDNLCQGTLNNAIEEADKAFASDAGKAAADVLAAAKLVADHDGGGNTWHTLKEAIYRAYRGDPNAD